MTSSAAFLGALFAKAAEPTTPLPTNRRSTKAGVALTAEASLKLQQLADWMELARAGKANSSVKLAYENGITKWELYGETRVSTFGALVQMFKPFKLSEATQVLPFNIYRVSFTKINPRAAEILELSLRERAQLRQYLYSAGYSWECIIKQIRELA